MFNANGADLDCPPPYDLRYTDGAFRTIFSAMTLGRLDAAYLAYCLPAMRNHQLPALPCLGSGGVAAWRPGRLFKPQVNQREQPRGQPPHGPATHGVHPRSPRHVLSSQFLFCHHDLYVSNISSSYCRYFPGCRVHNKDAHLDQGANAVHK